MKRIIPYALLVLLFLISCTEKIPLEIDDQPAVLEVRSAGDYGVRVTFKPVSYTKDYPESPALLDYDDNKPLLSVSSIGGRIRKNIGNLTVTVSPDPLTVEVTGRDGKILQQFVFSKDTLRFKVDEDPILGMGEGGPRPQRRDDDGNRIDWRELEIEYDRKGRYHYMQPRWQSNAYGSRNPIPLLHSTSGWSVYVNAPWVQVDLTEEQYGAFISYIPESEGPQTQENQHENSGKGLPPADRYVPGLWDFFVFDASEPRTVMKDLATISGAAVMPPRWSLGYMQSHRTLESDAQMIGIVDSFRSKKIPVDAVIYLGTGFCPAGWNERQPSFQFNDEVFSREPSDVIGDLHDRNVKTIVHVVPWDRDKLPTLKGNIPPEEDAALDSSHIFSYWQQHLGLVEAGIDGFWPDEGDWFNLWERIKRHQLYYQGPLSTTPNERPWSLHRNGYLGISKWGGWVWSGDTQSAWKTLEGQIAVGINHSLSISPYWGSDIGGFYPNPDKDGEMYARWFQFGAFCPSFRSHGRTWFTALPWGFGLSEMGPMEVNNQNDTTRGDYRRSIPDFSALNDERIEPVARKYAELRYQLLPYIYTMAWEARETGMPLMRALWLHYPRDDTAKGIGDSYLWGESMLIAPVYQEEATSREVYLPEGEWYDWWTGELYEGNQTITKQVDLSTMPIYVKAGAIIPFDPVRQYTTQSVEEPATLKIYTGRDATYTLYEDDGHTLEYLDGNYRLTSFDWDDNAGRLMISTPKESGKYGAGEEVTWQVELIPSGKTGTITYIHGEEMTVSF